MFNRKLSKMKRTREKEIPIPSKKQKLSMGVEPFSLFSVQPQNFLKCTTNSNDTIPTSRWVRDSNSVYIYRESTHNVAESEKSHQKSKSKTRYRRPYNNGVASRTLSWRASSSSEQNWRKNDVQTT